ncbi:hypothetical protein BY458DRAFT_515678 [Sporodiniella umbellata]|nr:hypothetical protein BY458DRAFT_515678 [Sporodiniella umbellata]
MRRQNNPRETWKPDSENSKQGVSHSSQAKAPPVILDRRVKIPPRQEEKKVVAVVEEEEGTDELVVPFMKKPGKFNTDAVQKKLAESPGHFVIGVVGKQGAGKSTILSHFAPQPDKVFPTQSCDQFLQLGHKTEGIDMYVTPERVILLDTEPLLSWAVLEKALRSEVLEGMSPDVWLEMGNIYNLIFLLSVCNVLLVVSEGPRIDLDLLRLVQRAELLKFNIPEYPLLTGQRETNFCPQVVFVCNKCQRREFGQDKYIELQKSMEILYKESQLKTTGLIDFSLTDFSFSKYNDTNVFLLPEIQPNPAEKYTEPFDHFVLALRDQILCAPRKSGKRGQVSEKDWFRNAMKTYELIHKSEFINEYLQTVRKLRDS